MMLSPVEKLKDLQADFKKEETLKESFHELINILVKYEATIKKFALSVLVGEALTSKAKGKVVRCEKRKKGETFPTACDAWQHADCVGYLARRRPSKPGQVAGGENCRQEHSVGHPRKYKNRNNDTKIVEMDGEYICQTCSALIQVTESPIASGATPILLQWHSEILR
ncbi:UNVERIFIED_CONTAM: hypothetical protein Sangu_2150100 [Sesamum angustifolium]|uniref:Uncharacterized protein n=1 Tax=Sesamum angustifolium TaxID=2727405 RepID=A0AAW2LEH1_9LAMI